MKRLMVLTISLCAMLCAAEGPVQKIVPVKNGDVGQMFQIVRDIMGNQMTARTYQNNIVMSGSAEAIAAAEQLIKNLEGAGPREREIDVSGYIILAGTQQEGGMTMPSDLEPVLKQFRNVLNYKSFRLVDTILLRSRENGGSQSRGFLALPNVPAPGATSHFVVNRITIADDVVRLKDLQLQVEVPITTAKGEFTSRLTSIQTDADVKAGQKVAIGKASIDNSGAALILVVSANVVN